MTELAAIILFLSSGFYLVLYGYLNVRLHERLQKVLGRSVGPRVHRPKNLVVKELGIPERIKPAMIRHWYPMSQAVSLGATMIGGWLFLNNEMLHSLILLIAAVSLCFVTFMIRKRQTQKVDLFGKQLPEAIEIIIRGARVGLSIEQSFKVVGEEMPGPTGPIFRSMSEKQRLGQDLQSVFISMLAKIDVKEFHFLAVTLILQQQSGGQYSNILQNLGNILRDRESQRRKLQALTSEARLSAKAIALIAACLLALIALTNESQIDFLVNEATGRFLLLYSALSMLFGFILISVLLRSVKE